MNAVAWGRLARGLLFACGLLLAYFLRTVLVPLLVAWLVTLCLAPLRVALGRRLTPGLTAFSLLLLLLVLVGALAYPAARQVPLMAELFSAQHTSEAPQAAGEPGRLAAWLESLKTMLGTSADQLDALAADAAAKVADGLPDALRQLRDWAGGLVAFFSFLALLPVYLYFLLLGSPWAPRWRSSCPAAWHPRYDRIVPEVERILATYCRARLLVALFKFLVFFGFLTLIGAPAAYLFSLVAALLSLLPVLGPLFGYVAMGLLIVASGASGGLVGLLLLALFTELFEAYLLLPRLVGRDLGLSDFAVVLAALCGGALAGIFGILIAIPAAAILRVLFDEFVRPVTHG